MSETNPDTETDAVSLADLGLTRRQFILATGYLAMGATLGGAVVQALAETASADPSGQRGTASDPLELVYTDQLVLHERTSDPSSPANGTLWYNSTA